MRKPCGDDLVLPRLGEADAELNISVKVSKEAFTMLAKNTKLIESNKLRFKNAHQRKTWIKEMSARARGITKVVKKYIGLKSVPKWIDQLGLPDGVVKPAQPGEEARQDEGDGDADAQNSEDEDESEGGKGEDDDSEEEQVEQEPVDDQAGASGSAAAGASTDAPAAKRRRFAKCAESEVSAPTADTGEAAPEQEEQTESAVEYDYGWDAEKRRSWRLPLGAKRSQHRELAVEMKAPTDGNKFSPMVAVFQDGMEIQAAITYEEYSGAQPAAKKMPRGRGRGRTSIPFKPMPGRGGDRGRGAPPVEEVECFKGVREEQELVVHFRTNDRRVGGVVKQQRRCCLRLAGKQLMQIDVKHFKKEEMTNKQVDEAAAQWLNSLAEKYASKDLEIEAIIEVKRQFIVAACASEVSVGAGEPEDGQEPPAESASGSTSRGAESGPTTEEKTAGDGEREPVAPVPVGKPVALAPPRPKQLPKHIKAAVEAATPAAASPAVPKTPSPKRAKTMPAEPRITPPRSDSDED